LNFITPIAYMWVNLTRMSIALRVIGRKLRFFTGVLTYFIDALNYNIDS